MNMIKNIVCIIQARTGSTRLPNKIFLDLQGKAVLGQVIDRLKDSTFINKIVIAAPESEENDSIEAYIKEQYEDVGISRGSEHDVLDRYYQAAKQFDADVVIRITSDCPLIDPVVVDTVIQEHLDKKTDYTANILGDRTYPRGLDTEVFSFETLARLSNDAVEKEDREHVTLYIRKHPELFVTSNVIGVHDYSDYRITLDTDKDYEVISHIYNELYPNKLDVAHVVAFLKAHKEISSLNKDIEQKYGAY